MLHFVCGKGPRSRCYESTAALTLIVQPWDEDEEKDDQFFFIFPSNGAPVERIDSATLSTTNPIWTDPGWNPGLREFVARIVSYLCIYIAAFSCHRGNFPTHIPAETGPLSQNHCYCHHFLYPAQYVLTRAFVVHSG